MRRDLATNRQAARFGIGNELNLLPTADMAEMDGPSIRGGQAQAHGYALFFGVHGDEFMARPELKAGAQGWEIIHTQSAESVIQVNLQRHRLLSQPRQLRRMRRAGSCKQPHITINLRLSQSRCLPIGFRRSERRGRIWHTQHHRHTAR